MTGARMKETVLLYQKGTAGTTPEAWEGDGKPRRAAVIPLRADAALALSAAFTEQGWLVTHRILMDRQDGPQVGRMLVRKHDGQNYLIRRVNEAGKPVAGTSRRYIECLVSELPTQVVTL